MKLTKTKLKEIIREEIKQLNELDSIDVGEEFFFKHTHPNKTLAGRIGIVKKIKGVNALLHMIDNHDTPGNWLPVPKNHLFDKHTVRKKHN